MLVVCGSTCNVIDIETWEMLKKKKIECFSRKSNGRLCLYGSNEPLTTAGEFETELCYKNERCSVCFVVACGRHGQGNTYQRDLRKADHTEN